MQSFGGAVALSPGVLLMNRLAADLQHLGDLLPAPPGTAGVIHVDALKSIGERAGQAALVAFLVAAVLALASIAGFVHAFTTPKEETVHLA